MSQTIKNTLFQAGALIMVFGAAMPIFGLGLQAPATFTLGVLLFAPLQILDRYEGTNFTINRLRRQQIFAAVLLFVAAALMWVPLLRHYGFFPSLHLSGGEWILALAISTVLELYTAFRIPAELNKEQKGK